MSICITKMPHECGSSDGLQVFQNSDGKYSGYCFACDTYVADPLKDSPGVPVPKDNSERLAEKFREVREDLRTFPVPSRALKQEALDYFEIKVELSQQDGVTPRVMYFPYKKQGNLVRYKAKLLEPKMMWWLGKGDTDMFGWDKAIVSGARILFITEGEPDAIALWQALRDKQKGTEYASLIPAVVSLTNGASGVKTDLSKHLQDIRSTFKEVVLVFDMDDAGKKATQEAMQILPTARSCSLPFKDANECVIKGKSLALANAALFRPTTPKNTRLVWGSSLYEAGRQQAAWGLSWPWKGMTEKTRGLRYGETYYIGAGVKMGKSEVVNTLAAHLITEHKLKVFMAKPEEANRKTYQMVVGKVVGKIFHDPKIEFDYKAYDEGSALVGDNLCVLNLYQHLGWDSLRADIMVAAEAGCKAIFIDPITNLVNGIDSGQTNTVLQEIAQHLAAIAKDLDLIIFIFCHLKAPESGPPHERGGKVLSHQFSGSRAMMRSCNYMLGLEGNKDPDNDIESRNIRHLILLEDREFGESGKVKLYWDYHTGLFNEVEDD